MIKLQPGDYVSTKDMTEEQYHAVCKAFMEAGCPIYEPEKYCYVENFIYFGWGVGEGWSGLYHGGDWFFTRKLTIQQILGQEETKMDIKIAEGNMSVAEAYKVMQDNCGIEVGDTVKVLRKAKDNENGWPNCPPSKTTMESMIGKNLKVLGVDKSIGIELDTSMINGAAQRLPFFVLELVKKGKKLPEPISISSQYQCEFKENGSIAVGCQTLDFDMIEKIYTTAKQVKESV